MKSVETLIVGGGISGLTAAWQLKQQGKEVELWEAGDRTGGLIETDSSHGYTCEQSASMVLNFRPEVSRFLEESGLDQHKLLRTPTSHRYLINQGELLEMPMKLQGMLFSPLWSRAGKLRLMLEPFVFRGAAPNESVADFIRRRLGSEMLEKAMSAYISGTLALNPELADSRSVLPRLTELEQRYGSLTNGVLAHKVMNRKTATVTEGFSFVGGMKTLVEQLVERLPGRLYTNHRITGIARHGKSWLVSAQTAKGEKNCLVKKLVLSTPAPVSAGLLKNVRPVLGELLGGIRYAPVSVVHLGYHKRQIAHGLEGTGFLTPWRENLFLNGSMWMHSLFSERAPQGHVLLSNYMGGARHPEIGHWDDQKRLDTARRELGKLVGIKGEPDWASVRHHQNALPLYHGKYSLRHEAITRELSSLPGLYLNANYLGGVSIRDRIINSQTLVRQMIRFRYPRTRTISLAPQQSCRT